MAIRRVVVTGLGCISPLGQDVSTTWENLIHSKSGISNIDSFDTSKFSCKIAGSVKDFDPESFILPRDVKKMDRFIQLGMKAAIEAIHDSMWKAQTEEQSDRTAVLVGSGIGGLTTISETAVALHESNKCRVSPFFIPSSLINLLSGHISMKYNFTGPNHSVVTACASGTHAIGDAMRLIQYDKADVVVAGGAEAPVSKIGVAGFASAKALTSNFNDNPEEASRPWDQDRSGFVMSEGAGILVLEEYEHAKKRGAKIYAEVVGYGMTGDAHHITTPTGIGAYKAMSSAMKDAQIDKSKINYINAHGTSTKIGDEIELLAVEKLFDGGKNLYMSSTKSSIGHLLGAAGSMEAIFTILFLKDRLAPPTLNLHNPLKETKIDLVPLKVKELNDASYAMSNSFGFGGTNASLVFKKY